MVFLVGWRRDVPKKTSKQAGWGMVVYTSRPRWTLEGSKRITSL